MGDEYTGPAAKYPKLKKHGFFMKLMTTGVTKTSIQRPKMRLYSHFANHIAKKDAGTNLLVRVKPYKF